MAFRELAESIVQSASELSEQWVDYAEIEFDIDNIIEQWVTVSLSLSSTQKEHDFELEFAELADLPDLKRNPDAYWALSRGTINFHTNYAYLRPIVAATILERSGFKKIHNIRNQNRQSASEEEHWWFRRERENKNS